MKIAPIDIAHKGFNRKMFGLDPEEVMEFLKSVSEEMETLIRERNQMKEAVREKELNILEYRERDKVLKDTIISAQRMSDKMKEDAEREVRLIINDAHQKAEIIVRDSKDSIKKLYREVTDLQKVRSQYEANMRSMMQAHLALLDQQDRYFPKAILPSHDFTAAPSSASSFGQSGSQPGASGPSTGPTKA